MSGASFSINRVFARAFALIGRAPLPILGLSLLFASVPDILWDLAEKRLTAGLAPEDGVRHVIGMAATTFAAWQLTLVQAVLTALAIDREKDRQHGVADYAGLALRHALPLLGLTIVNMTAVIVGSVLLLVPGMVIMTMWSLSGSVLVVERTSVLAALRRSARLTKGARWPIFGLILLLMAIVIAMALTVSVAGSAVGVDLGLLDPDRRNMVAYVLWVLTGSTMTTAIWAALMASLYLELRDWKDGLGDEVLAGVFA